MGTPSPSPRLEGIQALRAGNPDQAIALLTPVVMADAADAEAQAFLGVAFSQKGLHIQARQALETAVEEQPHNAHYRFNLGVALERAGERQRAAQSYREALQLEPGYAQAKARLQALLASGRAPMTGAPRDVATPDELAAGEPPWARGRSTPAVVQPAAPATPWAQPVTGPGFRGYTPASHSDSWSVSFSRGEAFWRRLAASLIDLVIEGLLSALVLGLGAIAFGSTFMSSVLGSAGGMGPGGGGFGMPFGGPAPVVLAAWVFLALAITLAIWVVYPAHMLAAHGQTLGKRYLGLRVVGPDGGNPSFWRAVLRETIGKWISSLVSYLGFLWMLVDEGQQTWHDKIAATCVVRHSR